MVRAKLLIALDQPAQAIAILRALLDQQPQYFEAEMELGNALMASKNHAEAAAIYRNLLRQIPASAELHFNLSLALKAQGALEQAHGEMSEAIRLGPDNANHYYHRALINFLRAISPNAATTMNTAGNPIPKTSSGAPLANRNGAPA